MMRRISSLSAAVGCVLLPFLIGTPRSFAVAASDSVVKTHIDDPGHLLGSDASWTADKETLLNSFEAQSGIRVLFQVHPKSPSADEDKKPGDYMRGLSARLGTLEHGVLVVFFADDPDWRIWVGNQLTPVFVGKAGDAAHFTESGEMHNAKEAFFAATLGKADAAFAALQKSGAANASASLHLKMQADALLGGLVQKLAKKQAN